MSFSDEVKKEAAAILPEEEHCKNALLTGLLAASDESLYKQAELSKKCCKKAFLRGIFLWAGSVTAPEKMYHLEMKFQTEKLADFMIKILDSFEVKAKKSIRKDRFVVYLKEGDEIVSVLALAGATKALLAFENVRVVKEVRNTVNRQVNCEAANLKKAATAGVAQGRDIEWIAEHIGFDRLPEQLREIAQVRLSHPEASLAELGALLDPPVGKSGVNHRLRRLRKIAEEEQLC